MKIRLTDQARPPEIKRMGMMGCVEMEGAGGAALPPSALVPTSPDAGQFFSHARKPDMAENLEGWLALAEIKRIQIPA
jgi:hypothetical protein